MNPGRQTDGMIAKRIWGVIVIHDTETAETYYVKGDWTRDVVPRYTTRTSDAHRVVSELQALGWTLHIHHVTMHDDGSQFWQAAFVKQDGRNYRFVRAETMPLAICMAALDALDGQNMTVRS